MAPSRPDQCIYTNGAMDIWAHTTFPDTFDAFKLEYADRKPSTFNIHAHLNPAIRAQKSMLLDVGRVPNTLFAYINTDEEIRFLRQKDASRDIAMSLIFLSVDATSDVGELKHLSTHEMEFVLEADALADLFCVVFAADTYRQEARMLRAVVMYCLANDGVMPGYVTTKEVQPEDFEMACMAVHEWHAYHGSQLDAAIWAPQDTEAEHRVKVGTQTPVKAAETFEDDEPMSPAEQEELIQLRREKLRWEEERADLERQITHERNATFDAKKVAAMIEKEVKELRDEVFDDKDRDDDHNGRYHNAAAEIESLNDSLRQWQEHAQDVRDRYHDLQDELEKAKSVKADFKAGMEEMMRRHFEE